MWTTDAPLTPEQMAEDRVLLDQVSTPVGTVVDRLEIYANGRLWYWRKPEEVYGDGALTAILRKRNVITTGANQ